MFTNLAKENVRGKIIHLKMVSGKEQWEAKPYLLVAVMMIKPLQILR
jgi:hypothetical protein